MMISFDFKFKARCLRNLYDMNQTTDDCEKFLRAAYAAGLRDAAFDIEDPGLDHTGKELAQWFEARAAAVERGEDEP